MRQTVPLGEWLPDQPDFQNPGSSTMLNVLSRTQASYGPLPGIAVYSSNALSKRCQGAVATVDKAGSAKIFAGDANDLYVLSAQSFSNVSKAAGAYACPADSFWSFAQFGESIYAANIGSPMQSRTLTGANFADVGGGSPKAKFLAVVKDFLVTGFSDDGAGPYPQRVWWSAINNPTSFPTVGSSAALAVQSDYQDIAGNQGWLQGIVANLGYADAAVFFERGIFRMQYVGYPAFFSFQPAEGVRGTPAAYSITQLGGTVYYLGETGFYAFDGANSIPIGANRVDRFFFSDVNQTYLYRVQGAVDPINQMVYWSYPSQNSTGICDRALAFNVVTNRWTYVTGITTEFIARLVTSGYTLESLSAAYPNLETVPYSLDSRVWAGGKVLLAAFDTSHFMNFFSGSNLAATMETSEVQLNPMGRANVFRSRPSVEGVTYTPSVSVGYRNRIEDVRPYTTAVAVNAFGTCPHNISARYHRFVLSTLAGDSWTYAQGVEVDFQPTGDK